MRNMSQIDVITRRSISQHELLPHTMLPILKASLPPLPPSSGNGINAVSGKVQQDQNHGLAEFKPC
jgi:hypothetical protein